MKLSKLWRIIIVGTLSLVPLALFAAFGAYDNPLGCAITTIPQFIKAVLTIIVKIGIPIATVFIIWSGFLFLTAQGDEAKLKTAKKAFVWACIGTAVLLGAWLLSIAIEGTIRDTFGVSGGTAPTNGGCQPPPPPTGNFFWPAPIQITKAQLANNEKVSVQNANAQAGCVQFFTAVELGQKTSNIYTGGQTPMPVNGNTTTAECKYDSGINTIQSLLPTAPEHVFLYVAYADGTSKWLVGPVGTDGSVLSPRALLDSLSGNSQVIAIYDIHTHPYGAGAPVGQKQSPPQLNGSCGCV